MPALPNTKHERFCQERAKGKTQDEAYEIAGYSPSRSAASRLSADVNICARIAEITERAAIRVEISKAWVMERLARNARMCLAEEPLVIPAVKDGDEPTIEYRRDPAAGNQALQLLGKELGMFVDRSISASTTLEELLDGIDDGRTGQAGRKAGEA